MRCSNLHHTVEAEAGSGYYSASVAGGGFFGTRCSESTRGSQAAGLPNVLVPMLIQRPMGTRQANEAASLFVF